MATRTFASGFIIRGNKNINFVAMLQEEQGHRALSDTINFIIEQYMLSRPDIVVNEDEELRILTKTSLKRRDKSFEIGTYRTLGAERKKKYDKHTKSKKELEAQALKEAMLKIDARNRREKEKQERQFARDYINAKSEKPFNLEDYLF